MIRQKHRSKQFLCLLLSLIMVITAALPAGAVHIEFPNINSVSGFEDKILNIGDTFSVPGDQNVFDSDGNTSYTDFAVYINETKLDDNTDSPRPVYTVAKDGNNIVLKSGDDTKYTFENSSAENAENAENADAVIIEYVYEEYDEYNISARRQINYIKPVSFETIQYTRCDKINGVVYKDYNLHFTPDYSDWDGYTVIFEDIPEGFVCLKDGNIAELTDAGNGIYTLFIAKDEKKSSIFFINDRLSYIGADGNPVTLESDEYTVITEDTTEWSGTMVAQGEVTINNRVSLYGDTDLILCDGAKLTIDVTEQVNGVIIEQGILGQSYSLSIFAQSERNGKLSAYGMNKGINVGAINIYAGTVNTNGITCRNDLNIYGGIVSSTNDSFGFNSSHGSINLGWTYPDDSIYASSYTYGQTSYTDDFSGFVNLNKDFAFENGDLAVYNYLPEEYYGQYKLASTSLDGKTLTPACKITFMDGEEEYAVKAAPASSGKLIKPEDPTKQYKIFAGWYEEGAETPFDFNTVLSGDITLYAKWDDLEEISYVGFDENGNPVTLKTKEYTVITSETTEWSGTMVAQGEVTINGSIDMTSSENNILILCDDAKLTINSQQDEDESALYNGSLSIYGQSKNTGKLIVNGSESGIKCTFLNVYGGDISATGTNKGIECYADLTVKGGKIDAQATDDNGTGIELIGTSYIFGGDISATGIYCGLYTKTLALTGGKLYAEGSGKYGYGIRVLVAEISGGEVTAVGGSFGYGLSSDGDVTISGGNIKLSGAYGISLPRNNQLTVGWTDSSDSIYTTAISCDTISFVNSFIWAEDGVLANRFKSGQTHLPAYKATFVKGKDENDKDIIYKNIGVLASEGKLAKPADPTIEGYIFTGWYTDAECTQGNEFDFENTVLTEDITLYAKFSIGGFCGAADDTHDGTQVAWKLSDDKTTLSIYGSGDIMDYDASYGCQPWYEYADTITDIIIGEGVTKIGDFSFFGFKKSESISLPQSLTSIGNNAFKSSYLSEIVLPENVMEIGEAAFSVTRIKTITLPERIVKIPYNAFNYCSYLEEVIIKGKVTEIGESAFQDCHALSSISLPGSVNKIGTYAFYYNNNLTVINYGGTTDDWNNAADKTALPISDGIIIKCSNGAILRGNIEESNGFKFYDIPAQEYTGRALTPKPEIEFCGEKLTEGVDYSLSYSNNIEIGTGIVYVTGIGMVTGIKQLTFDILPPFSAPKLNAEAGNKSAMLEWSKATNAKKYAVFIIEGETRTLISNKIADTSFEISDLINGEEYTFVVQAYNGKKWSGDSNPVTVMPMLPAPEVRATPGANSVTLEWNEVEGASKYAVSIIDGGTTTLLSNNIADTAYTAADLTAEKEYTFSIKAYDSIGKIWSAETTVTAAPYSMIPKLSVTAGATTAELTWNEVPGAIKYAVSIIDGETKTLLSNRIAATAFTAKDLEPGKTYGFIVQAYADKKWYDPCDEVSVKTKTVPVVTAEAGEDSITLTWNELPGMTKYAVFRVDGDTRTLISNTITSAVFTVSNLESGKTYTFVVLGYNGKKWTDDSAPVSATVKKHTLAAPEAAIEAGDRSAVLTWNEVSGAAKYAVMLVDGETRTVISNKITEPGYTVKNLTAGVEYTFVVRAFDGKKWSVESEAVSTVPYSSVPAVEAIAGDSTITLKWEAVPGATKYAITRIDGETKTLISNKVTATSVRLKNLTNGTEYRYVVQAYNGKKWSAYSNEAAATPFSPVPVLRASGGDDSIELSWNAIPTAKKYAVSEIKGDGTKELISNKITTNSYVVRNVPEYETRTYVVQAYIGTKWYGASESASAFASTGK